MSPHRASASIGLISKRGNNVRTSEFDRHHKMSKFSSSTMNEQNVSLPTRIRHGVAVGARPICRALHCMLAVWVISALLTIAVAVCCVYCVGTYIAYIWHSMRSLYGGGGRL